jgi:hypothetical protein
MSTEPEIVEEGRRLVGEAAASGIPIRLLGGVAVCVRASDEAKACLGRVYPDLDFVAHKKQSRAFRDFLEESGYEPQRTFNAMHGAKRLLYHAPGGGHQVDVFLDLFEMCHRFDLRDRLEVEELTLPAAELFLTKLQVVEINRKDIGDVLMLLWDHEPADADGPRRLNVAHVAALCGADWGLYTTIGDNLVKSHEQIEELLPDAAVARVVRTRLDTIGSRLDAAPKTAGWKLRARIGRRRRWYEVPDEVVR